jgi:hypothetical protein
MMDLGDLSVLVQEDGCKGGFSIRKVQISGRNTKGDFKRRYRTSDETTRQLVELSMNKIVQILYRSNFKQKSIQELIGWDESNY